MKNKLNQTKNDLSEQTRRKVIEVLNQHLAAALDLYSQAKQAHWSGSFRKKRRVCCLIHRATCGLDR